MVKPLLCFLKQTNKQTEKPDVIYVSPAHFCTNNSFLLSKSLSKEGRKSVKLKIVTRSGRLALVNPSQGHQQEQKCWQKSLQGPLVAEKAIACVGVHGSTHLVPWTAFPLPHR